MWNLRSNSYVLDDTWWEAGGNALWKRYARADNVNRETNAGDLYESGNRVHRGVSRFI